MTRDEGSAVVEFVVLVVLVLVPLTYVVTTAARVQAAAFAAAQAVREAGRAFVSSATPAQARTRATAAARIALADHGLELPPGALRLACLGGGCLRPGSRVAVSLDLAARIPLVPAGLGLPTSVPVHADHLAPVDVYRG